MQDLLEFLPVYSNINTDSFDSYENFNQSIFSKKEFNDEKIEPNELPKEGEKLFKGQRFVMKFLSSYTPYDELLLFHEMGVGKSRAAISAIENVKKENYKFDGAVIVAKGDSILNNFRDEVTFYTDDYLPENYENLPDNLKKRRLKASLDKFYDFQTFITFANYLGGLNEQTIKEKYSNKVIVIDEVHNLTEDLTKNTNNIWLEEKEDSWFNPLTNEKVSEKPKNINKRWIAVRDKNKKIVYKETKKNTIQSHHPFNINPYREMHRLIHTVKNCKVILLSGTPMKDSFKEIASLMNLILPLDEQLPVKKNFTNTFFKKTGEFYDVKDEMRDELKSKFKGRVSYLKSISSEIQKVFIGQKFPPLKFFTVTPSEMSDFQSEIYKTAYEKDSKKHKKIDDIEDLSTENDDDDSKFEDEEGDFEEEESEDEESGEEDEESGEEDEEENEEDEEESKTEDENEEESNEDEIQNRRMRGAAANYANEIVVKYNFNGIEGYGIVLRRGFKEGFVHDKRFIYVAPLLYRIDNGIVDIFDIDVDNLLKLLPENIEFQVVKSLDEVEKVKQQILRDSEQDYNNVNLINPSVVPYKKRRRFRNRLGLVNDNTKRNLYMDGAEAKESSFYYHSRHASLFVFPDGSYGKDGFKKYIKEGKKGTYTLTNELKKELVGKTNDEKLEKLRKFSSKYADVIEKLLDAYENKKSSFVYCNSVSGGGLILFSLILEVFGFSKASGFDRSKSKRYAFFLTGKTDFAALKNKFNDPRNKHGEYISVILGSRSISEGLSFKNIQEEHIITPHYNYGEIEQAIARGFRYKSHMNLIEVCKRELIKKGYDYDLTKIDDVHRVMDDCETEGIEFPQLNIFQYVAIPNQKRTPSVDVTFYKISEIKDVNIKKIERLMKESAVDCAINKERNLLNGYDNMRECEYLECQYECDDIPSDSWNPEIDYSTDFMYYFKKSDGYQVIKEEVKETFRKTFKIDFDILKQRFAAVKHTYLLQVLYDIIVNKELVSNKFGIPCYVKESNGILFLTDDFADNDVLSEYYTKNPNLVVDNAFEKGYEDIVYKSAPRLIEFIFDLDVDHRKFERLILAFIKKIDIEIQETLLEYCIIAEEKGLEEKEEIRKYLLNEIFRSKYKKIDGIYVSWLLFDEKVGNYDKLRFLDDPDGEWRDADKDEDIEFFRGREETVDVEEIKNNPFGYYGTFDKNKKTNEIKFKIVKILAEKTTKKNKIPSGKVCNTFEMIDLIEILEKLGIHPSQEKTKEDKEYWKKIQRMTIDELKKIKGMKKNLKAKIEEITDEDEIRRYVFWYGKDRMILCEKISKEMKDKALIV